MYNPLCTPNQWFVPRSDCAVLPRLCSSPAFILLRNTGPNFQNITNNCEYHLFLTGNLWISGPF